MYFIRYFLAYLAPISVCSFVINQRALSSGTRLFADTSELETLIESRYPTFFSIIKGNNALWKEIQNPQVDSYTIFCPSEDAFQNLDEKRMKQLNDYRNEETVDKICSFHVVNEAVSAEDLFNSGGVVTMGGDVLVDRSVSGGFFGIGGQEDGSSTVGGAKVTLSEEVGSGVIHEVDNFVSPNILWRYMDQLRIPGSS